MIEQHESEPEATVTVETPEVNDILITRERAFTPDELLKGMHLPEGVTIDREGNEALAETPTYPTFVESLKAAMAEVPTRVLVGTVRNIDADSDWSDAVQARLDEAKSPESLVVSGDFFHQPEVQERIETELNNIKDKPFGSYLYPSGSAFENRTGKQIDLGTMSHNAESLDPFSGVETSADEPNDTKDKE